MNKLTRYEPNKQGVMMTDNKGGYLDIDHVIDHLKGLLDIDRDHKNMAIRQLIKDLEQEEEGVEPIKLQCEKCHSTDCSLTKTIVSEDDLDENYILPESVGSEYCFTVACNDCKHVDVALFPLDRRAELIEFFGIGY